MIIIPITKSSFIRFGYRLTVAILSLKLLQVKLSILASAKDCKDAGFSLRKSFRSEMIFRIKISVHARYIKLSCAQISVFQNELGHLGILKKKIQS